MKEFRLPKEFAEKWIAALRSGKYKQGDSVLYFQGEKEGDDSYCCLGIAGLICNIPKESMIEMEAVYPDDWETIPEFKDYPETLVWEDRDDSLNLAKFFAHLNDGVVPDKPAIEVKRAKEIIGKKGYLSFEEIADWIEQNVELY